MGFEFIKRLRNILKMKFYLLVAFAAVFFIGFVRAEENDDEITDLAEDDFRQIKGGRWVNPLVLHAIRIRHQYRICKHRLPIIIRKCNIRIRHLTRIYNHLRVRVAKSKRVYYYWLRKYRHCNRYCWWRRGGRHRKGDGEVEE